MCSSLSATFILICNSIKIQFGITRSFANAKFLHGERNKTIRNNMSNGDTKEEAFFRERYAQELRKKKQQDSNSYRGNDELNDEKRRVNQQELKTPGRRGEQIKQEELDREIARRSVKKESNQAK
jgi:hypothetical protein